MKKMVQQKEIKKRIKNKKLNFDSILKFNFKNMKYSRKCLALGLAFLLLINCAFSYSGESLLKSFTLLSNAEEEPQAYDANLEAYGSGTKEDPYQISNVKQLQNMFELMHDMMQCSNGNGYQYNDCYYELKNNIVVNDFSIGENGNVVKDGTTITDPKNDESIIILNSTPYFDGNFNGNGFSISGIWIDAYDNSEAQAGLFGKVKPYQTLGDGVTVDGTGIVSDLTITNSVMKLNKENDPDRMGACGLLAGRLEGGTISDCCVENSYISVETKYYMPEPTYELRIPENETIDDNQITYTMATSGKIGGLIGSSVDGMIVDCKNSGTSIDSPNARVIGGILGYGETTQVINCTNSGNIIGNSCLGGIVGLMNGEPRKTAGADTNTPDAQGKILSSITGCSNSGQLLGVQWKGYFISNNELLSLLETYEDIGGFGINVGGIAGLSGASITNCVNDSIQISGFRNVGGIVGQALNDITGCSNMGPVILQKYIDDKTKKMNEYTGLYGGGIAGSIDCNAEYAGSQNALFMNNANDQDIQFHTSSSDAEDEAYIDTSINPMMGGLFGYKNSEGADPDKVTVANCLTMGKVGYLEDINDDTAYGAMKSGVVMESCYYALDEIPDDAQDTSIYSGAVSREQLASGEVSYVLQSYNDEAKALWGQNLIEDSEVAKDIYPKLYLDKNANIHADVVRVQVTYKDADDEEPTIHTFYTNSNANVTLADLIEVKETEKLTVLDIDGNELDLGEVITADINGSATIEENSSEPSSEDPSSEEPSSEEPSSEEPSSEEPSSEEPSSEEPSSEEPSSEEPSSEEPSSQEPSSEEPSSQVPSSEEPSSQDPAKNPSSQNPQKNTTTSKDSTTKDVASQTSVAPIEQNPGDVLSEKEGQEITEKEVIYEFVKSSTGDYEMTVKKQLNKKKTKIVIPDYIKIDGVKYPITSIAKNAYKDCKKITSVKFGKNIITVGQAAFKNCTGIKKVTYNKKLEVIGTEAFYNCKKLKTVSLPSSVRIVGKRSFKNCKSMKKFVLGQKVKYGSLLSYKAGATKVKVSVKSGAMENCSSLKKVVINSQVREIGDNAFKKCGKLSAIIVYSLILKTVGKRALSGVSDCKISVPKAKIKPYSTLFKNKGQGKKVVVAKM